MSKNPDFYVLSYDHSETTGIVLDVDMSQLPRKRNPNSVSLNPKIVDDIMDYKWNADEPVPCKIMEGNTWTDFVNNTFGLLFCLDAMLSAIHSSTAQKLETTSIQVTKRIGVRNPPSPVSWLRVPIGCGPVHPKGLFTPREQIKDLKSENYPRGVYFDLDSWTGLDLFRAPNFSFFVTPRLADALKASGLSGISLERAVDYGFPR